jgi:arylsulfatase A-like enzyme
MLYEDLTHVPLLIKLPHQQIGRRVAVDTEHADLLPTMLDYLGQPVPHHVEGRSLRAALEGLPLEPRPIYSMDFEQNAVFSPLKTGSVAMLDGRYKYVAFFGKPKEPLMPKLDDALYDLQADPGETKNLIAEEPSRAAKMRAAIQTQVAAHSLPLQ